MTPTSKAKRKRDAASSDDEGEDALAQRLAAYGAQPVLGVAGLAAGLA